MKLKKVFAPRSLPALMLAASLAVAGMGSGCSGGSTDPMALLRQAGEKAVEVSQSNTALRVRQSLSMQLNGVVGDFEQNAEMTGAVQMPDRERYEYRETWSGSLVDPEKAPVTTFSYVTMDGGRTAYVKGSQLEQKLGVMGWVYYMPAAGESRYFDYLQTVQAVTGYAGEATLVGEEDANGAACWRLEVVPAVDDMIREQFESNPAFAEEYRDSQAWQNVKEVKQEIWISREGSFTMRIYTMMILENAKVGEVITLTMQVDFEGYGEALLLPIDAPAVYTKVE